MVLGVAVTRVERLANGTRHREARDRRRLASDGLSAVLGLEESSAHGPAARPSRCARADSEGGARESALGRATDPRRAAEARRAGLTGNHCEVHRAAGDTALAVMPHLRGHSRRSDRGGRFLRRPDGHRSPAVRARPSGTRAPPNRPCRRHVPPYGSLDRATIPRSVSVGSGAALSHSRIDERARKGQRARTRSATRAKVGDFGGENGSPHWTISATTSSARPRKTGLFSRFRVLRRDSAASRPQSSGLKEICLSSGVIGAALSRRSTARLVPERETVAGCRLRRAFSCSEALA